MTNNYHKITIYAAVTILACSLVLLFQGTAAAQDTGCNYDRTAPSLDNARLNFKSLNYRCAELELLDRLRNVSLSLKEKADAHVLLAAVYYAMEYKSDGERRNKVVEQFTAAFKQYREWKGTLDVDASEFAEMMEDAKRRVDSGESIPEVTGEPVTIKSCPSSTTALIGSAVFVAAAGFFIVSSSDASSKWDDYENNPDGHDDGLYEDYESANNKRNIVGVATIATGVVTGYLWMKYISGKKKCSQVQNAGLDIAPSSKGVILTYRF